MTGLHWRTMCPDDHSQVIAVVDEWWGGRRMAVMLPRLFFDHFHDTSLVVEDGDGLAGFLLGFMSQSQPDVAYCHFIGVRPDMRRQGVGDELYRRFFELTERRGRGVVRAITSPVNARSIAFHRRLGFRLLGDDEGDLPVVRDYDGPGSDRVVFERRVR